MMGRSRVSLLAAALIAVCVLSGTALVSARPRAQPRTPEGVVADYFAALNAGMRSGDFSAVGELYAEDATLTQSNPLGVTKVFRGRDAILGFYRSLPTKFPGYQWSTESLGRLAPGVVLAYERAGSPAMAVPGRCFHVFQVHGGVLQSVNWVTYYGGQA
jgi:hypothetical protein